MDSPGVDLAQPRGFGPSGCARQLSAKRCNDQAQPTETIMSTALSREGARRMFSEKRLIRPADAWHMRNQSNGRNRIDSQRFGFQAETSGRPRRSGALKLNSLEDCRG